MLIDLHIKEETEEFSHSHRILNSAPLKYDKTLKYVSLYYDNSIQERRSLSSS